MSVAPGHIGWASYRQYEGPFWRGSAGFVLPDSPTEAWIQLAVLTATEGGHFDSYNGYDSCDCTSGLIQWCDRGQYSVCDMLGAVAERDPLLLAPLFDRCARAGVTFGKNGRGRWRYFFSDERGEVDRTREQDELYHLHATGHKGTWDDESRAWAKDWAAAISSVWHDPTAQQIQVDFTVERLGWFVGAKARPIYEQAPATPLGRAFRAAYISYAANNPSWAQKHLLRADSTNPLNRYTAGWLVDVLQEMTFGPGVSIYPHRYNAIRPVLERHFEVDLPDFASELASWQEDHGPPIEAGAVQRLLVKLGYDIGKSGDGGDGVDGAYGPKTRRAVRSFQETHGLDPTGYVDGPTRDGLVAAAAALDEVGDEIPAELRDRVKRLVGVSIAEMARKAVREARA